MIYPMPLIKRVNIIFYDIFFLKKNEIRENRILLEKITCIMGKNSGLSVPSNISKKYIKI